MMMMMMMMIMMIINDGKNKIGNADNKNES